MTALCVFLAAPKVLKAWQSNRLWQTWAIRENTYGVHYKPLDIPERIIPRIHSQSAFNRYASVILRYNLLRARYLNLNLGQG